MGVHGLWKLLEPCGKMVPLEALAGKVLAVDVSIWLHQALKGMHDTYGAPVAAAHLLILFHRICKLLYYKIKPIFVFDGGVPALKQLTMAARRRQSNNVKTEAIKIREKLIKNLLKHEAVRQVLANETASAALGLNSFTLPGPSVEEDLYKLPPIAADYEKSSDEQESDGEQENEKYVEDIHSIDVTSKEFLNLPPEVRHDILTELMETRKQNSWKHLDSMPKESDNFSDFQMNRLLKRHAVNASLEQAGKEMGGKTLSLKDLESMLDSQGVLDNKINLTGKRIAQDSVTQYVLIRSGPNNREEGTEEGKRETSQQFDIMNHLEDVDWSSEADSDIVVENCKIEPENVECIQQEGTLKTSPPKLPLLRGPSQILEQPKIHLTKELADVLGILQEDNVEKDVLLKVENLKNKLNINCSLIGNLPNNSNKLNDGLKGEKKQIEKNLLNSGENKISANPLIGTSATPENKDYENSEVRSSNVKEESITPSEDKTAAAPVVSSSEEKLITKHEDSSSSVCNNYESALAALGNPGTVRVLLDNEKFDDVKSPEVTSEECRNCSSQSGIVPLNPSSEEDTTFAEFAFESICETEEGKEKEWEDENAFGDLKKITNVHETEIEEPLSRRHLVEWEKSLKENQRELMMEQGKRERHALNPTDQMYLDAQDLLKLFGVPFVVAPMEAEAQCAVLNTLGLTEGTITDDSDIWLFGGGVVYKNFFNQNKYVLEYKSDNIKKYFKLEREDLIKMAYLVGSDYTLGLNGIGPVTALEIIAAFPGTGESLLESLEQFRDWFTGKSKNKVPRAKLKNKIKKTVMLEGFPNKAIAEAYLRPHVDDSTEPFSWAKPNLDLIREFAKSKMGWSFDKSQELLLPVFKKLEENTNQITLEKYFKKVENTSLNLGMMSRRVENAVKQLGGEEVVEPKPQLSKERKPRKKNSAEGPPTSDGNFDDLDPKPKRKRKPVESSSSEYFPEMPAKLEKRENSKNVKAGSSNFSQESKIKMINEKLHRVEKIPQKEKAQILLEERKKEAVKIFKTYKGKGKRKIILYSKKEVNLSESSSDGD